jgi:tripartite-type tricarboxylate transporter receptor subunit TctC
VPSFKEAGYPQLAVSGWYGVFAPAGTPGEIVERYNDVVVKAVRSPEVRERMRSFELEPREMSVAEFQSFVKADTERWAPIIKASGFKPSSE